MIEGDSVVFSILLHSITNLVSVLLGSLELSYGQERMTEGIIILPIIVYLCKATQNLKVKSECICLFCK